MDTIANSVAVLQDAQQDFPPPAKLCALIQLFTEYSVQVTTALWCFVVL